MVVIVVRRVPRRTRGLISHVLIELESGVYVGDVSARIREALWEGVINGLGDYSSVWMVYHSNQRQPEIRSHNTGWRVVDFDGAFLVERPLTTKCKRREQ